MGGGEGGEDLVRNCITASKARLFILDLPVLFFISNTEKITNLANARIPFSSMFPSSQNA